VSRQRDKEEKVENPSSLQGLRHAHRGGLYRVYIPLYPVQCFPANKQVMKNSESYVRFFFFCSVFEQFIIINASALKAFKMQLEI